MGTIVTLGGGPEIGSIMLFPLHRTCRYSEINSDSMEIYIDIYSVLFHSKCLRVQSESRCFSTPNVYVCNHDQQAGCTYKVG